MAAKEQLNDEFNALGLSMRSVKNGKNQHEITEISIDAKTDNKTFVLPADYTTTSPFEMMKKALANMPQARQGTPLINGKPPADMQTQIEDIIKQRQLQKQ